MKKWEPNIKRVVEKRILKLPDEVPQNQGVQRQLLGR